VVVGQDLHLDVAGLEHGLFEIDGRIPERRLGFAAGGFDRFGQRGDIADAAHAAAPPPPTALTNNGNLMPASPDSRPDSKADTSSSTEADGATTSARASPLRAPRQSPETCFRSA